MRIITISASILSLLPTAFAQQLAEVRASDAAKRDLFGYAVSLGDGVLLVGASRDDDAKKNAGAVYVFTGSGGSWTELVELHAGGGLKNDFFGSSLSADGATFIAGAPGLLANQGSAYVFVESAGVWSQEAMLDIGDVGDLSGSAVALSGDTAVVGAPLDDDLGTDSGTVKVYVRSAGVWTVQAILTSSDAAAGDHFGAGVSVDGDTLLVGAPKHDAGSVNTGAAYVFVRVGGVWTQEDKLVAGDPEHDDAFGQSVSIAGDTALLGAFQKDEVGVNSGAAYIFVRTAGLWTQQSKLVPAEVKPLDSFGHAVALEDGLAVVGSDGARDVGASSGAVYLFSEGGGGWSQIERWTPPETDLGDFFGSAVDVAGGLVAIGSGWDDDDGFNSGSAHLFTSCAGTVFCDNNPDNSADIAVDICVCSTGSINITMTAAPVNVFGYLLVGAGNSVATNPPGAQGDFCLNGSPIGRYSKDVGKTDGSGSLSTDVLNAITGGGGGNLPNSLGGNLCMPSGQTWNFQYWHRNFQNLSRFSKAISVTFR